MDNLWIKLRHRGTPRFCAPVSHRLSTGKRAFLWISLEIKGIGKVFRLQERLLLMLIFETAPGSLTLRTNHLTERFMWRSPPI